MPVVSLIQSLPHFVTPEVHADITSATPQSLHDIPPVLRLLQKDVTIQFDPAVEDIRDNKGELYVIDSVLAFLAPSGRGFQISYPDITLHAIARGEEGPSIYCQLDETPEGEDIDEDGDAQMRELRIIPDSPEAVEPIFEAMSQCAALHPDKTSAGNGDEDALSEGDSAFDTFDGNDDEELSEAALAHLESIIDPPKTNGVNDALKSAEKK